MEGRNRISGMTPEKLEEVQRVHDVMAKAMDQEIWRMAELMVTRRDDQLFGETEFLLREKALRMGAQALEATVDDRKKRGIKAAASSVPTVAKTDVSSAGGRGVL
jgi:hypothetical protein